MLPETVDKFCFVYSAQEYTIEVAFKNAQTSKRLETSKITCSGNKSDNQDDDSNLIDSNIPEKTIQDLSNVLKFKYVEKIKHVKEVLLEEGSKN